MLSKRLPILVGLALGASWLGGGAAAIAGCAAANAGGGGGGSAGEPGAVPGASRAPLPSASPSASTGQVRFRLLERGATSQCDRDTETVIKDAKHWADFYAHHHSGQAPPKVDFQHDWVVAVVLHRTTGGYALELGPLTTDGQTLTVSYTEYRPGPNALTTQVLTQPFAFAAIPATRLPIRFQHLVSVKP